MHGLSNGYKILPEDKNNPSPFKFGYEYECWNGKPWSFKNNKLPITPNDYPNICYNHFESFNAAENVYGYEFKSHIATIPTHKTYFYNNGLYEYIKKNEVQSPDCGIHISLNRSEHLNKLHSIILKKILIPRNIKTLLSLGTRKSEKWGRLDIEIGNHYHILSIRKGLLFEFRLFSASPENLFGAMEMLETMFLSAEDIKEQELDINSYIEYTKSKEKEYPVINQLIQERISN